MKKKLLALLATCFLQAPIFAVLEEVIVLTKGDQMVYLYGDWHESHTRYESIELDLAQNRYWPNNLFERSLARTHESWSTNQANLIADRIARLERERGENFTVMLESYGQISPVIYECIKELRNSRRPNHVLSPLCNTCCAAIHKQAKTNATREKWKFSKVQSIFSEIEGKLPETIRTICVDTRRKKYQEFYNYCYFLWILDDFKLAGIYNAPLENEIREAMGTTSLKDLGINENELQEAMKGTAKLFGFSLHEVPIYTCVTSLLNDRRERRTDLCIGSGRHLDNIPAPFEFGCILNLLSKCSSQCNLLDDEALEQIRALEETQKPGKVVLLAGTAHTRNLEKMLGNQGFAVQHQSSFVPKAVNLDVLDTAKLEKLAPRQARASIPPPLSQFDATAARTTDVTTNQH